MAAVSLTPDLTSISQLELVLEEFASNHGLVMPLQLRLNLMLEELVTNSVDYSLQAVEAPKLDVNLSVEDDFVVAILEDNGREFNPFEEAPVADTTSELTDRPIGGLGVLLTKKLADEYDYKRVDERNCITLRCKITGETEW